MTMFDLMWIATFSKALICRIFVDDDAVSILYVVMERNVTNVYLKI
jgi:hypothetical protein